MNVRRCGAVAGVEWAKLVAHVKTPIVLAVCTAGPFVFALAIRIQSSLPEDTLFGRAVKESGFAIPLVVLGFASLWLLPALTSLVGGDAFAAEDRYGTWKIVLTRSCSRGEVFAGKVATALAFSVVAVAALAASSAAAGALVIGRQPLIDLSGALLPSSQALTRVALAWASVVPPTLAFTALAVLLSVATRSSAAGIALPVVASLVMQFYAFVDGPEVIRWLLVTSAFGAWHGLLSQPPYYGPLLRGTAVSVCYVVVCLAIAYRLLRDRDIVG